MKKYLIGALILAVFLAAGAAQAQVPTPRMTISWTDNSNNEDGFTVERASTIAGPFTALPNTGPDAQQLIDWPLTDATQFCYRVKAFNIGGSSPYLGPACRTTQARLIVVKTGSGTVTGGGIDCGATCGLLLAPNASVTLTAAAVSGSTFTGWSGACSGTGPCQLTMDARKDVMATFSVIAPPAQPSDLGLGD